MNKCPSQLTAIAALCVALSGCGITFVEEKVAKRIEPASTPLITALNVKPIEVKRTQLQPEALEVIRDGYAELADKIEDDELTRQLNLRLADVEMLLAEEQQVEGTGADTDEEAYQRAINAYKKVLTNYPGDVSEAEVLYQLSRAYDLQGKGRESAIILSELLKVQPDSLHANEAWFRQGEGFFSGGDYKKAADAYAKVLASEQYDTFYTMSAYMQGWSFYKLEAQEDALIAFDKMLTASFARLPDAQTGFTYQLPSVEQLSKGQQRLVQDSLRVMGLLFSYRGNGEAIIDFYQYYGDKPHSYLVYNELAQQHLDNDRYLDAAEAYLAFAQTHATHSEAVPFYVKHIDAFILGDFPSEVLSAKAGFIATFGLSQGIYRDLSLESREKANPYLHTYLQELAQSQHSFAQQLNSPQRRQSLPEALQLLDDSSLKAESMKAYSEAAAYYHEFIDTFPDDALRPQMQFNLAESYYEAEQYAKAIEQYEDFAYRYVDHEKASDGAYTALLAYDALLPTLADESLDMWLSAQRKSRDNFVVTFVSDERVVPVVQTLMQSTFDSALFDDALFYSAWLLTPPAGVTGPISPSLKRSAKLVEAHSHFGLQQYAQAEASYAELLVGMSPEQDDFAELNRNYAVSMYQQAQAAVEQEDFDAAIEHLKRIIAKTPNVDVRINAQYDAASYLLAAQRFDEAQEMLLDFERRFPTNELTATIEDKLLYIYEETEQWQNAADILYARWQVDQTSPDAPELLFVSAEYFEKAGNREASLPAYRTYAHTYPEPFSRVTEARFIMSEFYVESGEDSKRRFWLNKLIQGHDNAGSDTTVRSQTLAAMAAMVFADDARLAFADIKLTQPLKSSLGKKRKALTNAVSAHNKVLGYGVREYATVANHQLGTLYRTLASDLMASDRPSGLNDLELEQYDILLEEQAYPFEEQAIGVFETNAKRSWKGTYDEWVQASFTQLEELLPSRYRKPEQVEALTVENY